VGLTHYAYWHPTATCGTFAAAAGVAKLLGLQPEQLTWALGSAGTQAAGLWEFLVESAMSKPLHIGKAASNGLLAASLAARGLTGAKQILEGEKGFFRATSQDHDVEKCTAGLGRDVLYEQTALKLHASCGHTHPAIDAALRATGGSPLAAGEIEQVDVFIYKSALDLLEGVEPTTPTQAKFNLPYCVATALTYGQVGLVDFETARLSDSDLLHVMERTVLHSDSEYTKVYPKDWPARVKISTRRGEQLEGHCENPRGGFDSPLSEYEIRQKFRTLAGGELSPDSANQILERVLNLEDFEDVNGMFLA
jgi:2-methylcitrate dehydratase PrpD